jgi:hypothetical protein
MRRRPGACARRPAGRMPQRRRGPSSRSRWPTSVPASSGSCTTASVPALAETRSPQWVSAKALRAAPAAVDGMNVRTGLEQQRHDGRASPVAKTALASQSSALLGRRWRPGEPALMSACATSRWPYSAAYISGVQPCMSTESTVAPSTVVHELPARGHHCLLPKAGQSSDLRLPSPPPPPPTAAHGPPRCRRSLP